MPANYYVYRITDFPNKTFVKSMRMQLTEVSQKYRKSLEHYNKVMDEIDNQGISDLSDRIEDTFANMANCKQLDAEITDKTKHVSDLKASYNEALTKVVNKRNEINEECCKLQMTNLGDYEDNFLYYDDESFEPYLLNAQTKFITQFNACIKPFIKCLKNCDNITSKYLIRRTLYRQRYRQTISRIM